MADVDRADRIHGMGATQIQSWWLPWIFGADQRALTNQRFLERTFKIFPSSLDHPAPDGMHFVLDVLLFFAVLTLAVGLLTAARSSAGKAKP